MVAMLHSRLALPVVVDSAIRFTVAGCPPELARALRVDLSIANPEHARLEHLGKWTGHVPRGLEFLERDGDCYVMPRGALGLLRQRAGELGQPLELQNHMVRFPCEPILVKVELRPYQIAAVEAMVAGVQGVVEAPCGSGKTTTAVAAIGRGGQPSLVIAHTHALLGQWCEQIWTLLKVRAGTVTEGVCNPSRLTVATVQTLVRLEPLDFQELVARFGLVLLDECHHVPASTFRDVLSRIPALYRFGLTATPERDDGLGPLVGFTLGPTLHRVGYDELVGAGYLQRPEVCTIRTSFTFDWKGPEDWGRCMQALVQDPERNNLIARLVAREVAADHTVLILSTRIEHLELIRVALAERGIVAEVLVGKTKASDRASILERFRSGSLRVVLSSQLADEGLDVPRLDRLVLAAPSKARGRTVQRLGRIMRCHPGKVAPVLFDLVDSAVGPLRWQAVQRQRAYAELLGVQPEARKAAHG